MVFFTILNIAVFPNSKFEQMQKIVPVDRRSNDNFGQSLSINGNNAIVGASGHDIIDENKTIFNAGSAYIFERDSISGKWNYLQKLVPRDFDSGNLFGDNVVISDNYAIITSTFDSKNEQGINYLDGSGSVYIFEKDNKSGLWNEVQKIVASDRDENDNFGISIAINGNTLAVGAAFEDQDENGKNILESAGSTYIFEKDSITKVWEQKQKIVASDRDEYDMFGWSLSISQNYLIIGARGEDENVEGAGSFSESGSVYIFEKDSISGLWNEVQKIVSSDRDENDWFGSSLSIDKDYFVVGAMLDDDNNFDSDSLNGSGSAYIYKRNNEGLWEEVQKIVASNRKERYYFGSSVSIYGNLISIGAPSEISFGGFNYDGKGAAYIFKRDSEIELWEEIQILTPNDLQEQDRFGSSVSIFEKNLLVGAPWEDEDKQGQNTLEKAGSAYIFEIQESTSVENIIQPLDNDFHIYPNPSNGITTIFSKINGNYHLYLINQRGEKVLDIYKGLVMTNQSFVINLEDFSSGNYFLISESKGKFQSKNLLVID
jgi:hypothetical protein